jgi:uncharacterized membrane protein YozB (DUF420 family)
MAKLKALQILWSALLLVPSLFATLEGTPNAVLGLTVTATYFAACVAAAMNYRIGWYFAPVIPIIAFVFYTFSCVSMLVSLRAIEREGEAVGILLLATANTVLLVLPSLFICLLMIAHRREILSILLPEYSSTTDRTQKLT